MFIYIATNSVNGKKYVGQTIRPVSLRWKIHCASARNGEVGCRALNRAIRKYGTENFTLEIITLPTGTSQHDLNLAEQFYIKALNTIAPYGYNLSWGGGNSGPRHPETRARIGAAHRGRKRSEEARRNMSLAHRGKKQTPEEIERRIAPRRGRPLTIEHRLNIAVGNKGKKQTPEQLAKLSAVRKGRIPWNKGLKNCYGPMSEETRKRRSLASTGRTHTVSAEARAKISAANKGKNLGGTLSLEQRQKIAASVKASWPARKQNIIWRHS